MGNNVVCSICGHKLRVKAARCPECGAVYPQSSREQFDFYEKLYDNRSTCVSYLRRGRVYKTIANKILHISKNKGAMAFLDIGASVGISIVLLEQYGEATGIELDIPQLRRWHKFLGIESAMIYMKKGNNIDNFYGSFSKELKKKIDAILLIDTLRYIPLPKLIDIAASSPTLWLKKNGTIIIKEINPDNRSIFANRISGKHGDLIMYSPKTISYLARRNKLAVDWYIIAAAVDNLAIKVRYNILRMLRPSSYVAVLRREDQNDCCNTPT